MARSPKAPLDVRTHRHADKRVNIPTAEVEPVMRDEDKSPIRQRQAAQKSLPRT